MYTEHEDRAYFERKRQKTNYVIAIAALLIFCMIGSGVFAFGGTYLANSLNRASAQISEPLTPSVRDTAPDEAATGSPDTSASIAKPTVQNAIDNTAPGKMSIEDVVINVKHAVVEIKTERVSTSRYMREFVSTGAGSGVIISEDGYIVTNDHVISGAQVITVRLSNEQEYTAILIGTDPKTDIAVLKINADGLQPAITGHSSGLLVGQTAIAIGNPLGELGGTVTAGIISALDREITIDGEIMSLLQTDAAVNPGNSGGGLFDLYGELIGIVNAKSSGSEIEGLGFAIPIDTAIIVAEQLIEYGYVRGRVESGFTLVDIQDAFTAMSYRIQQLGLYIANSKSENFESGDRIIAVDGHAISNLAEWNRQMTLYEVGDTVDITVVRNGSSVTQELTLAEKTY